jgi:ABC-type transport system involved in cytochrome bd biosynthesis fused ATPase/permease subunit
MVAVAVGLRLLAGDLDLRTALFVLVIAPEAYLPLRTLAANYHASADGVSAAQRIFAVLEAPVPRRGRRLSVPDPSGASTSAGLRNGRTCSRDRSRTTSAWPAPAPPTARF